MKECFIKVGSIVKPHGVKGNFVVEIFNLNINIFLLELLNWQYKKITLQKISTLKNGRFIANIVGVTSRDQVDNLINTDILCNKMYMPKLAEDSFYASDLLGLKILSEEGVLLGYSKKIFDNGFDYILEVEFLLDKKNMYFLFNKKNFPFIGKEYMILNQGTESDYEICK